MIRYLVVSIISFIKNISSHMIRHIIVSVIWIVSKVVTTVKYFLKAEWITAFATVILAVFAIISAFILFYQIQDLHRQTKYIAKGYEKSIEPLCKVNTTISRPKIEDSDTTKISYKCDLILNNVGNGPLQLIGIISHASISNIDFRKNLLNSDIDICEVKFDSIEEILRGLTILPKQEELIEIPDIVFNTLTDLDIHPPRSNPQAHLYSLILYKDSLNNLYDVLGIYLFKIHESIFNENFVQGKYIYHVYNNEERKKIINFIKKKDPNHNMLNHLINTSSLKTEAIN